MKRLIILLTLITTTLAQAGLTPDQFGKVRNWANREGLTYSGIYTISGIQVFLFENEKVISITPTSSDTPDEAINGLIASTATFRRSVETFNGRISEEKEKSYRQGYIDGSQLRQTANP